MSEYNGNAIALLHHMADALVPIRQAVPMGSNLFVDRLRTAQQTFHNNNKNNQENQQPTPSFGYQQVPFTWIPFTPIHEVVLRYY